MAIDAECRTFTLIPGRGTKSSQFVNEIKAWTDRYLKRWDAERGGRHPQIGVRGREPLPSP